MIQNSDGLIGKKEDIEALAKKKGARLLVYSDSHGNTAVVEQILKNYGKNCDALIFCGDGISDLAQIFYKAQEDSSLKKSIPKVIAFVQGNGDSASYPLSPKTSLKIPRFQNLTVNNKKFLIVHGHNQGVDWGMEQLGMETKFTESSVAFYGHTHIAKEETVAGFKFINPGSCARPRGGQPKSFAIVTVENSFVDTAFIRIDFCGTETSYRLWQPL